MISDQLQIYLRRRHLMSKYGLSWVGSFKVTSCTCQLTTWTRQKKTFLGAHLNLIYSSMFGI